MASTSKKSKTLVNSVDEFAAGLNPEATESKKSESIDLTSTGDKGVSKKKKENSNSAPRNAPRNAPKKSKQQIPKKKIPQLLPPKKVCLRHFLDLWCKVRRAGHVFQFWKAADFYIF